MLLDRVLRMQPPETVPAGGHGEVGPLCEEGVTLAYLLSEMVRGVQMDHHTSV